jgi:putative membrane protein
MIRQFATTAALLGTSVLLAAGGVFAAPQHGARLSATDKKFVKEAAQGGMAEVALGHLAIKKASSPTVKQFGERMVNDHTKANDDLKQVAAKEGFTLPTGVGQKNQQVYDRLSRLSGAAFDKTYMSTMVKGHEQVGAAFRHEAKYGQNPAIKAFASRTLPTVEHHLQMAQNINGSQMKAHRRRSMSH